MCKGDHVRLLGREGRGHVPGSVGFRAPSGVVLMREGITCHTGSAYLFLLAPQVCNLHSLNVNCKSPILHFLRNQTSYWFRNPSSPSAKNAETQIWHFDYLGWKQRFSAQCSSTFTLLFLQQYSSIKKHQLSSMERTPLVSNSCKRWICGAKFIWWRKLLHVPLRYKTSVRTSELSAIQTVTVKEQQK